MKESFLTLSLKLTPNSSLVRNDSIGDKPYTVVPMVMMVEGVHIGSDGPLLYTAEQLGKMPQVWNTKPVVVYHPEADGAPVSACSPESLATYGIGMIMNAKWDDKAKRLQAEAWLEPDLIQKVDSRVGDAITDNEMMEVSIGVYVEKEAETGTWEGPLGNEDYIGIATNLRPDHLAVLPDRLGACSIADGAGLLRNERKELAKNNNRKDIATITQRLLSHMGFDLKNNELSYSNIITQLRTALHEALNLGEDDYVWIEDVYTNFFIYEQGSQLYRIDYTVSGDSVTITGEPTEVRRVTEYRTVDGNFVGNELPTLNQKPNTHMNKDQMIQNLLATPLWNESNKEFLKGLEADQLQGLLNNASEVTEQLEANKAPAKPSANATGEEETLQSYIAKAPAEVRDTLTTMSARITQEKQAYIDKIVACESNRFTADALAGKSHEELSNMAALIPEPKTEQSAPKGYNFAGQGDPASFETNEDNDKPLVMPSTFEDAAV